MRTRQNLVFVGSDGQVGGGFILSSDLKFGDIVMVREWDDLVNEFGLLGGAIMTPIPFIGAMRKFCGHEFRVIRITGDRVELQRPGDTALRFVSMYSFHPSVLEWPHIDPPDTKVFDSILRGREEVC